MKHDFQLNAVVDAIMDARGVTTLRRAPVRAKADLAQDGAEIEDWRGEKHFKVKRNSSGGGGFNMKSPIKQNRQNAVIKRRDKVAILHGQGLTETDIAASVGCSATSVYKDLVALGLKK